MKSSSRHTTSDIYVLILNQATLKSRFFIEKSETIFQWYSTTRRMLLLSNRHLSRPCTTRARSVSAIPVHRFSLLPLYIYTSGVISLSLYLGIEHQFAQERKRYSRARAYDGRSYRAISTYIYTVLSFFPWARAVTARRFNDRLTHISRQAGFARSCVGHTRWWPVSDKII